MSKDWLQRKNFVMHSGEETDFKIECDHLTNTEIETFAYLISKRIKFSRVFGIPSGGIRIANALKQYEEDGYPVLIADDVYTTGTSMRRIKETNYGYPDCKLIGVVLFARGPIKEDWIKAVFQMW